MTAGLVAGPSSAAPLGGEAVEKTVGGGGAGGGEARARVDHPPEREVPALHRCRREGPPRLHALNASQRAEVYAA